MKDQHDTQVRHIFTDIADAPDRMHKPRILQIDIQKYQERLDHSDLSPKEKAEFLHTIWSIVLEFYDLGYQVHPVQHFCGKDQGGDTCDTSQGKDLLNSKSQPEHNTKRFDADPGIGESDDS